MTNPSDNDPQVHLNKQAVDLDVVNIDVAMLRLGGKRMTKSVFEQIPIINSKQFYEQEESDRTIIGHIHKEFTKQECAKVQRTTRTFLEGLLQNNCYVLYKYKNILYRTPYKITIENPEYPQLYIGH